MILDRPMPARPIKELSKNWRTFTERVITFREVSVDSDTLHELKYNDIDEIWISGASVMLGHLNKPNEMAKTVTTNENGVRWIRTGDLGYMTQEGLVYHKGRIRHIYMTAHKEQPPKTFPNQIC